MSLEESLIETKNIVSEDEGEPKDKLKIERKRKGSHSMKSSFYEKEGNKHKKYFT